MLSLIVSILDKVAAEEVDSILAFIANDSSRGSSVIFDYIFQSVHDGTHEWEGIKKWQKAYKRSDGYPPFGIKEGTAQDFLSKRGFGDVKDVNGEFLKSAYLKGAHQIRQMFTLWGIVHATVKPREGS